MPTSAALVAVIPHPDDEAYSMAGTLHVAAAAGATVTVVCATRGELGEDFSPVATTQLGARRSAELAASCAAMGVQARWLDLPDGGLASLPPGRLEAALREALAALAPQAVLSLGPDGAYGHQDHLALTSALTSALPRLLCDPRLLHVVFPPGLFEPQWCRMTQGVNRTLVSGAAPALGMPGADGDLRIDVRPLREVKLATIAAHRSQLPDGRPHSLFPAGVVEALLVEERFRHVAGPPLPAGAGGPLDGLG